MNLVKKIAENYHLPYYTISPTYSVCTAHGYIAGEHYTCPECGGRTEVYSRITGYYRPVANWNDGKSEEFKERKVYNLENSHLTPKDNKTQEKCCEPKQNISEPILFTTKTCPNCKMAKTLLSGAGIKVKIVDAAEDAALAKQYGVTKAPTMFVQEKGEQLVFNNVSDIKKYVEERKKA